jgi:predicted AAA+ superfamily ATPase
MSTLLVRYLKHIIDEDLKKKMVFIGGPRQVGKTTLAQSFLKDQESLKTAYFNWDSTIHRKKILAQDFPSEEKIIILDEIHKFRNWRSLVKGFYDTLKNSYQFIVTGSARLDYYRKGGDSLLGRYYYFRVHPITWPEGLNLNLDKKIDLDYLLKFGGFPEPFLSGSPRELKRWQAQRTHRIVNDDIRDLESIRDLSRIELLINALPERVSSPLSRKNLAEDLEVDFKTVEKWIQILERVYYCFRIPPYGAPKIRAVKKEQKVYLWDWSELQDPGSLWENFIASHLLKYCHYHEDVFGEKMELRFLRDIDGREIDFVVLKNSKPLFAVECKAGEKSVSPHLKYFAERTKIPVFYQVHKGKKDVKITDNIRILPFEKFCELEKLL